MHKSIDMDIELDVAFESLTKDAQQVVATKERDVTATASLVFLLEAFGKRFLSKEQKQKMQTIIELHEQCLYPYAYAARMKEASTNLPTVS